MGNLKNIKVDIFTWRLLLHFAFALHQHMQFPCLVLRDKFPMKLMAFNFIGEHAKSGLENVFGP